jgi:hypothetical protein
LNAAQCVYCTVSREGGASGIAGMSDASFVPHFTLLDAVIASMLLQYA